MARHTPQGEATGKVGPGDVIPVRELRTIRAEPVTVPARDGVTHLQFRRFASCPICNVHLRTFARRHHEILGAGITEVVLFHSAVAAMLPHQGQLPFAAVADPDRQLYDEFGVGRSPRSVLHPRAWTAPLKPYAWSVGLHEARDPGGGWFSIRGDSMLGLPADFLLDPAGSVLAAHYGTHANDQWSVDDLLTVAALG